MSFSVSFQTVGNERETNRNGISLFITYLLEERITLLLFQYLTDLKYLTENRSLDNIFLNYVKILSLRTSISQDNQCPTRCYLTLPPTA